MLYPVGVDSHHHLVLECQFSSLVWISEASVGPVWGVKRSIKGLLIRCWAIQYSNGQSVTYYYGEKKSRMVLFRKKSLHYPSVVKHLYTIILPVFLSGK